MKLGNLATRVGTAFLLIPLLILAISWERPEGVWAAVFVATLISLYEYMHIALDRAEERWMGVVLGAAVAAGIYWWGPGRAVTFPAAVVIPALYYLFRFGDLATVANRLGLMTFGVIYAGALLTFVALAKRDFGAFGADFVYLILMTGWFGDTLAYFAGRAFGRKKLYPAVSPAKTWAGAVGGIAGSLLAAVLANLWYFPELGWVHGAVITAVGGALGQMGDLVESMLKRSRGVKDSGGILPGHGGILDRIDAVLFIAPWVYLYAILVWQ